MKNEEIRAIERVIKEVVTMKEYGVRDGITQYEILTVDGESIPEGYILIAMMDGFSRVRGMNQAYFRVTSLGTDNYYGRLEVFYCKKKKSMFGKDTLKTLNAKHKTFHIDGVENGTEEKMSMKKIMAGK